MKRSDVYPSQFFKAADFADDWTMPVEIEMARLEEIGDDKSEKLVVYFRRTKQGLVAGPTIFDQICDATGQHDTDSWKGHRVELFRDMTTFGGRRVACIRVRATDKPPAKKPLKKPPPKTDFNDEVAF